MLGFSLFLLSFISVNRIQNTHLHTHIYIYIYIYIKQTHSSPHLKMTRRLSPGVAKADRSQDAALLPVHTEHGDAVVAAVRHEHKVARGIDCDAAACVELAGEAGRDCAGARWWWW